MSAIIPIYKPTGMTSHDVVDYVRRVSGERRVGHAGTLDPLAEGVLVVGVGREATKQLGSHMATEKEYRATVIFGATSTTDDAEGEIEVYPEPWTVSHDDLIQCLEQFQGHIEQVPPVYSAVKVRGMPSHRRVRKGQNVELSARSVYIQSIELCAFDGKKAVLRVVCGAGVYIRSLARDVGVCLGVGAYLGGLVRTRVGAYRSEDALPLSDVSRALHLENTND